jgi:hypothetical protein
VRRHAATVAAAAVAIGGAVVLLAAGRGTWFYLDEWDFSLRAAHLSLDSIMGPNNQNWHGTVVLLYRAIFELFGFHYAPFRLLATGLVVAIGLLAYVYARRRIGPWWALIPLALVVASPSFEVQLWPFQMGQLLSGAGGLGALLLLDRDPTRGNRAAAAALLVLAVASSSVGVPLVALIAYDRLLTPGRRREVLVALPAVVAYAIWYAEWGTREPSPNEFTAPALSAAADRVVSIGDGVVTALLGLTSQGAKGTLIGQIGFAVLVVAVCWRIFGPYSKDRPRVIALAAGLVTFWCLLAWGRGPQGAGIEVSGRYLFLSQVLVVLLLAEVGAGVGEWLRAERARGRRWAEPGRVVASAAVAVVVALALVHHVRTELDFGGILRENARAMRGQVYGLSLLPPERRAVAPFYLEALGPQIQRSASPYFDLMGRFAGPDPGEEEVRALPADARGRADLALFGANLAAAAAADLRSGGAPPEVGVVGSARPRQAGPCVTVRSAGGSVLVTVRPPPSGMAVENLGAAPLELRGRRYAPGWAGPGRVDVAPKTTLPVILQPDQGSEPWRLRLSGAAVRLCSLAPA